MSKRKEKSKAAASKGRKEPYKGFYKYKAAYNQLKRVQKKINDADTGSAEFHSLLNKLHSAEDRYNSALQQKEKDRVKNFVQNTEKKFGEFYLPPQGEQFSFDEYNETINNKYSNIWELNNYINELKKGGGAKTITINGKKYSFGDEKFFRLQERVKEEMSKVKKRAEKWVNRKKFERKEKEFNEGKISKKKFNEETEKLLESESGDDENTDTRVFAIYADKNAPDSLYLTIVNPDDDDEFFPEESDDDEFYYDEE